MKKISEDKFLENITAVSNGLKAIGRLDLVESLSEKVAKYCVAKSIIDEAHDGDDFTPVESKENLGEVPGLNEVHDQMMKIVMKEAGEILGIKKKAQTVDEVQSIIIACQNIINEAVPNKFYFEKTAGSNYTLWYGDPGLTEDVIRVASFSIDGIDKNNENAYNYFKSLTGTDLKLKYDNIIKMIKPVHGGMVGDWGTSNKSFDEFKKVISSINSSDVQKANTKIANDLNVLKAQSNNLSKISLESLELVDYGLYLINNVFHKPYNSNLLKASVGGPTKSGRPESLYAFFNKLQQLLESQKSALLQKQDTVKQQDPFVLLARNYRALSAKLFKEDRKGWEAAIQYCGSIANIAESELNAQEKLNDLSQIDPLLADVKNFQTVYNNDVQTTSVKKPTSSNKYLSTKIAAMPGYGAPVKPVQNKTQPTAKPSTSTPAPKKPTTAPVQKQQTDEDEKASIFKKMLDKATSAGKEVTEPIKQMQESLNVLGYYLPQINEFIKSQNERLALSAAQVSQYSEELKNTGAELIEDEFSQDGVWGKNTQKAVKIAHGVLLRYNHAISSVRTEDPIVRTFPGDAEQVKSQYPQIDIGSFLATQSGIPSKDQVGTIANNISKTLSEFFGAVKSGILHIAEQAREIVQPEQQTQQAKQPAIQGTPVSYDGTKQQRDDLNSGWEVDNASKNEVPFNKTVRLNFLRQYYQEQLGNNIYLQGLNPIIDVESLRFGNSASDMARQLMRPDSFSYEDKTKVIYGGKVPVAYSNLDNAPMEDANAESKRSYIDQVYDIKKADSALYHLDIALRKVYAAFIQKDPPDALKRKIYLYLSLWTESISRARQQLKRTHSSLTTATRQR